MPPSCIRVRAVVWAYGCRQTDTQTRVTTIHFASSTTHAKCNNIISHIRIPLAVTQIHCAKIKYRNDKSDKSDRDTSVHFRNQLSIRSVQHSYIHTWRLTSTLHEDFSHCNAAVPSLQWLQGSTVYKRNLKLKTQIYSASLYLSLRAKNKTFL